MALACARLDGRDTTAVIAAALDTKNVRHTESAIREPAFVHLDGKVSNARICDALEIQMNAAPMEIALMEHVNASMAGTVMNASDDCVQRPSKVQNVLDADNVLMELANVIKAGKD